MIYRDLAGYWRRKNVPQLPEWAIKPSGINENFHRMPPKGVNPVLS